MESVEEEEGVEVFMEGDDFWLKKGGCKDSSREIAEKEGVVIVGEAVIIVEAAVVLVRGAVEWLSGSDPVLAVNEGKVVVVVVVEGVEWRGRGDVEAAEEKNEEVKKWWSDIRMAEDGY